MSQAIHLGPNYARRTQWFACPRCDARQEVTDRVWAEVEVLGVKPTLDVCKHQPHIPPSPAAQQAHDDDYALALLLAAIGRDK